MKTVLILVLLLGAITVSAQSNRAGYPPAGSTKSYTLLLKDGAVVSGQIVRRDSITLVIRLRNGEFTYADPTLVAAVEELNQPSPGNPFAPFLTLNQTAYTADPGRLYYRNVLLFYNELDLGISRNWSIGASVVPVSLRLSDSRAIEQSVNFSTKVSFPLGRLARIGAMATYQPAGTREYYKTSQAWNLQALLSLGDGQRNVTIGYGRSSQNDKRYRQPYFTISAMLKLSPTVSFITDNTLFTNQNQYYSNLASLFSAAIRLDRPRHAFDLGVVGATYAVTYFSSYNRNPQFFPYLAYNLRFGR